MFVLVIIIVFWIVSGPLLAQKEEIEKITEFIKKKRINAAYFLVGGDLLNQGKLNNYLDQRALPALGENYFTIGLGGHIIHDRFVIGLEVQKFIEKKHITTREFNTSIMGKYWLLNLGYLLYSRKGFMIYPLLGMGLGELNLRVIENNISSFEDITMYQRGSESRTMSLLINMGWGFDYFINFNEKRKGQNNIVVGVRVGYKISAVKFDWSVNHIQVADGPNAGLCGVYLKVIVGLGGWVEKLIKKVL